MLFSGCICCCDSLILLFGLEIDFLGFVGVMVDCDKRAVTLDSLDLPSTPPMPHQPGRHVDSKFLEEIWDRLEGLQAEIFTSQTQTILGGPKPLAAINCHCASDDCSQSDCEGDTYCPHSSEDR